MEHGNASSMRTAFHVHVPGKLRRAKNRMVGARSIPDDPLLQARTQLGELDCSMLEVAHLCQQLLDAASVFEMVPRHLSATLHQIYVASSGDDVAFNTGSLYAFTFTRFTEGAKHSKLQLEEMLVAVKKLYEPLDDARSAFTRRDDAFQQKAHYDTKAKGLSHTASIWTQSENKFERNVEKLAESRQHLQYHHDVATIAADDALTNTKLGMLSMLSSLNDFCGDFNCPRKCEVGAPGLLKNMLQPDVPSIEQLAEESTAASRPPPLAKTTPRFQEWWNPETLATHTEESKPEFPRLLGKTNGHEVPHTNPFTRRGAVDKSASDCILVDSSAERPANQVPSPPLAVASTNPWRAAWGAGYRQVL